MGSPSGIQGRGGRPLLGGRPTGEFASGPVRSDVAVAGAVYPGGLLLVCREPLQSQGSGGRAWSVAENSCRNCRDGVGTVVAYGRFRVTEDDCAAGVGCGEGDGDFFCLRRSACSEAGRGDCDARGRCHDRCRVTPGSGVLCGHVYVSCTPSLTYSLLRALARAFLRASWMPGCMFFGMGAMCRRRMKTGGRGCACGGGS